MNIQEQIDEIIEYLKEDCSYYGIIGTIHYGDIDPNEFKKQEVQEFSFGHVYFVQKGSAAIEDYYSGITLIPIGNDVYAKCEWSS